MAELHGMALHRWENDPKLLGIMLARYKFVARMLEGKKRVLEVGCADGFGSRVVRQVVGELVGIDIDRKAIAEARDGISERWPVQFREHDIMSGPLYGFDAVYCLDVFEHIADENRFLRNLRQCAPIAVIGTPSLESQKHANEASRRGHVNCKSGLDLKRALECQWGSAFIFSMSDEVVHTGFQPMAHYLIGLATP